MNTITTADRPSASFKISNDILFSSFSARSVELEFRDCWISLDGDIGTSLAGLGGANGTPGLIGAEEVINRYRAQGEEFLSQLKGGFRLLLWDRREEKLLVATDPFATKSVYYFDSDGRLAVGGSLTDVTSHPSFDRQLDKNVLFFYLNHSFVPAPYSIYRGVRRLQPGQCLIWQGKRLKIKQYWDIAYDEDLALGESAAAEQIYAGLCQALQFCAPEERRQTGEVGAFLSGGTDSSTLVGLLTQLQPAPVKAFSVGFTEQAYNEIAYARIAAKQFGADAHEYFVSAEDALAALPTIGASFDEPFGNSSAIPTYYCLRKAKETGVKFMLAGDGGDELFGGNERYVAERRFLPYDCLPEPLQKLCVSLGGWLPRGVFPLGKIRRYVERASEPNPDRFFYYQLYLRQNVNAYFTPDLLAQIDSEFPLSPPREHYRRVADAAPLNRLLYMDLKMCIADNDLFKVNRMADSLGINVCYPYLDRDLAELTGRIPVGLKVKGTKKRYIFKRAFQNLLPAEILSKTKHGFGLPIAGWLRTHSQFKDLAQSLLLDRRPVERGYFERETLVELLRKHEQEPSDFYGSQIWQLMMLELWHQRHFDR